MLNVQRPPRRTELPPGKFAATQLSSSWLWRGTRFTSGLPIKEKGLSGYYPIWLWYSKKWMRYTSFQQYGMYA